VRFRLGDHGAALAQLESALALFEQVGDRDGIAGVTEEIGRIYAMENYRGYDPVRAEQMLLRALALFEEGGVRPLACEAHRSLSTLYRQQGRWEQSQNHLEKHHALREEIQIHEAFKLAQQFEQQRQMAEIEKQRAVEHAEAEASRLRAELLETQLERKQQELASTAMHLARQVEMLGAFRNDLRDIMRRNSDPLAVIREFRQKVNELPAESIDWPKFEVEFQQTYPGFRAKLLQRCPDATKMEVKICSLLMLRLTTEDIGKLLSISSRSVEWHRANIRRKLGLSREVDLHEVLSAL
jgi:DNA-binding CsgD family transcriptional regulator